MHYGFTIGCEVYGWFEVLFMSTLGHDFNYPKERASVVGSKRIRTSSRKEDLRRSFDLNEGHLADGPSFKRGRLRDCASFLELTRIELRRDFEAL